MAMGRGLSELLGEVETSYSNSMTKSDKNSIKQLDVNEISANPNQPRKVFDEEKIQELSESIKTHGLLQPITVIKDKNDKYILVSGERRLRAHKLAGLDKISAIISSIEEFKLREVALIENIQRDDLNIIELAYSYAKLLNEHSITHEDLSKKLSKSRTAITNTLRLLQLSVFVQQLLGNSKITAGHAKILIGLSEEEQKMICDKVVKYNLSVREAEKLVKDLKEVKKPKRTKQIQSSLNFDLLKNGLDLLKKDNFKVKLSDKYLKIDIKNQEDVEKLSKYFNILQ